MTPICTCPSGDGSLIWPCPIHPTAKTLTPLCNTCEGAGYVAANGEGTELVPEPCPDCVRPKPVATLRDDGYFTWKSNDIRLKYDRPHAGWRMDVYAVPQPAPVATDRRTTHCGNIESPDAFVQPAQVAPDLVDAANALLHQIDIGDFVDSYGHSAKMLKPVHDLMRLLSKERQSTPMLADAQVEIIRLREDAEKWRVRAELAERTIERHERRQARAAAQPSDEQIVALAEEIAGHLCDTYICGRVWSAWQVGTMSEDDFTPVDESDLPYDIACAVLALRPVAQPLTDEQIHTVIRDVAELPNRSSPDGWPDAMIVTADELQVILGRAHKIGGAS